MTRPALIYREKRLYNAWVASQTLEDYALRYTADSARRWSSRRVANTAVGSIAFLASEAIGATITLAWGFSNAVAAIAAATLIMFLVGLPIARHAASEGLDIDLLTRGAGFGYLGSTITSLFYASFTFLLFALEASIMGVALSALTGMAMPLAYTLSALVVIPVVIWGMRGISRAQAITQPVWLVLQLAPVLYILWAGAPLVAEWRAFTGIEGPADGGLALIPFGLALSILLSLLPQIGEQADYLRFLPRAEAAGRRRWWAALLIGGPGWALIAGGKLLLGSLLAVVAVRAGATAADAQDPTAMFRILFETMTGGPGIALLLAVGLVLVAQFKINITNAYAGSIAWSNFFARVTHHHPGRVVWLVFNVALALLLMQVGMLDLLSDILVIYAILAAGWIGALAGDLALAKPLGLSPAAIEFKRAHLYDINPVGTGAMALSILVAGLALAGIFGVYAQAFAPLFGLALAFVAAPAIALATGGRFYIARTSLTAAGPEPLVCVLCENRFERPDMAHCPFYAAPICSLCCTLESRCHDSCKTDARAADQLRGWLARLLPRHAALIDSPVARFILLFTAMLAALAVVLALLDAAHGSSSAVGAALRSAFWLFGLVAGLAAWIIVLGHESRRSTRLETQHHLDQLTQEIAARQAADAELDGARQAAEAANQAKSRFLVSVSHEVRAPLNAIYGYAQLLERGADIAPADAARVIRSSCEHLTHLVEGLHDISEVESGVLRLASDTIAFPEFVRQIVSMIEPQASARGLGFVVEQPRALPSHVRADEKRLRQVLLNLLSNALKFTDAGEIVLKVGYRSDLATIEVTDTGIGIDPADIERVFAPFERGRAAAAHRRQGIGLGLSITAALVQIMGGEITVESRLGKGTTFRVRIRLRQVAAPVAGLHRPAAITGYTGPRRTILLIDDDPNQLAVLKGLLAPLGFAVLTAPDGESGLGIAGNARPDLVLLDIAMPGLSGWKVAERLHALSPRRPRIVMVSANAHESRRPAPQDPHDAFLLKPVDLDSLLSVVAQVLQLSWISAPVDDACVRPSARTQDVPALSSTPLPVAASPYLAEITRLARSGRLRALKAEISRLEADIPDAAAIAGQLRGHLESFDFRALIASVERAAANG